MIEKEPMQSHNHAHHQDNTQLPAIGPEGYAFETDISIKAYGSNEQPVPYQVYSLQADEFAEDRRDAPEQDDEVQLKIPVGTHYLGAL
jgi:hypothetical protein